MAISIKENDEFILIPTCRVPVKRFWTKDGLSHNGDYNFWEEISCRRFKDFDTEEYFSSVEVIAFEYDEIALEKQNNEFKEFYNAYIK